MPVWAPRGAFARPLAPGTYRVTAAAQGYASQSQSVAVPDSGDGVAVSFELRRAEGDPPDALPPALFPFPIIAGRGTVRGCATGGSRDASGA